MCQRSYPMSLSHLSTFCVGICYIQFPHIVHDHISSLFRGPPFFPNIIALVLSAFVLNPFGSIALSIVSSLPSARQCSQPTKPDHWHTITPMADPLTSCVWASILFYVKNRKRCRIADTDPDSWFLLPSFGFRILGFGFQISTSGSKVDLNLFCQGP